MPHTASFYAIADRAGGEKVSAIRKALADLHRLLDDSVFRSQQAANAEQLLDDTKGALFMEAGALTSLHARLGSLASLRSMCRHALESFRHGVVYAVRLSPEFLRDHCELAGIAIKVFAPIPPSELVAKLYLPRAFKPRV